jgi:hypothetical protein
MHDRACPLAYIVAAAFASGLVWACALVAQLPVP